MNEDFATLEEQIIEIEYLVRALQILSGDDGVHITLLNVLEQKCTALRADFYKRWQA
ncbi:MAG: hypothetical protein KDJ35_07570 [Alphaproteobacteria bacterium]|nr:hypothetical protein [Alphaproteobacteria bacterium]